MSAKEYVKSKHPLAIAKKVLNDRGGVYCWQIEGINVSITTATMSKTEKEAWDWAQKVISYNDMQKNLSVVQMSQFEINGGTIIAKVVNGVLRIQADNYVDVELSIKPTSGNAFEIKFTKIDQ